jgi:hypothetical protein
VIAWASDAAACAESLRARFAEAAVLELRVSPRGALASRTMQP